MQNPLICPWAHRLIIQPDDLSTAHQDVHLEFLESWQPSVGGFAGSLMVHNTHSLLVQFCSGLVTEFKRPEISGLVVSTSLCDMI